MLIWIYICKLDFENFGKISYMVFKIKYKINLFYIELMDDKSE